MVEFDPAFCITAPYGVLKTTQVIAPLATVIALNVGPYKYAGIGIVLLASWVFFFTSLLYLIFYMFGVQRKQMAFNNGAFVFMPLALTDFLISACGGAMFLISTLISLICVISSIEHRTSVLLTYVFTFAFTLIAFLAYSYYCVLIYRAIPNGRWSYLQFLIINGDSISVHAASGLPTASLNRATSSAPHSAGDGYSAQTYGRGATNIV